MNVLRNKKGIAILSVLLMFTVMMILVGALTMTSVRNINQSKVSSQSIAAFYAAEAGLNMVVNDFVTLNELPNASTQDIINGLNSIKYKYSIPIHLNSNEGQSVSFQIDFESINDDLNSKEFSTMIVCKGHVGSYQRTLEKRIDFSYGLGSASSSTIQLRHAVLVKNSIMTGNGSIKTSNPQDTTIKPRIATLSTKDGSIDISNGLTFTHGEIELTDPTTKSIVNGNQTLISDTKLVTHNHPLQANEVKVVYPTVSFGPIQDKVENIKLTKAFTSVSSMQGLFTQSNFKSGTFYIPHLDFSNNQLSNTLTVSNDIFILTDKITLGPVNLNGEGKLTIYVSPGKETFNVQDNGVTFGRSTNQEKLEIYVDSFEPKKANDYHVAFSNNSTTHAYLMFANARVGFGQNAKLNGAIYTGATDSGKMYAILLSENAEITSGNQKALLVAPSGTVYMSNNSNLRGAVIAQDFEMGNGSDKTFIAFDPDFPQNIPFDITTPIQVPTPGGTGRQLTIHQTKER